VRRTGTSAGSVSRESVAEYDKALTRQTFVTAGVAAGTLAALDRYEDFRPDDPEASLFLRVEAEVTLHDVRTVMCWVYVYNCNGGIYSCNGRDR